jgi:hypothetical protein
MARVLAQSNIEQFTKAFLSKFRNANEKRSIRPYVQKAIVQINFFLDPPCCDDPEASVTFARRNNSFTQYIAAILNNEFDRRKWRKSLIRTVTFLREFLVDPCCCLDDVFNSFPGTVLDGGGETTTISFCGASAELPTIPDSAALLAALIELLNANAVVVGLTGTFTAEDNLSITYTGCACVDPDFVISGSNP